MPMLSDQIRKGSTTTEPVRHDFFSRKDDKIFACALGAAYYALCEEDVPKIFGMNQAISEIRVMCHVGWQDELAMPEYGPGEKRYLLNAVMELNDTFGLSREAIADRLETEGY